MTKEQKILMLLVLLVAGGGVTLYISTQNAVTPDVNQIKTRASSGREMMARVSAKQVLSKDPTTGAVTPPMGVSKKSNVPYLSNVIYEVPENGHETIHLVLFVKEGIIQDVRFTFDPASKRQSGEYLNAFNKALAGVNLKGQKVSEVSLSRVGGASLTTGAFMKAIAEINVKASA